MAEMQAAPQQDRSTVSLGASDTSWWGTSNLLSLPSRCVCCLGVEATESLVELCGEQAPECGDAYCRCGRALLELARKEAGVLGPDLDGASSRVYCLVIVLTCWSVHSRECLGNENKRSYGCLKMHLLRAEYTRKLLCLRDE
ncbi:histone-binding protein N1/N2-like isoform X6 [Scylla paramamosain]|uniref:histone-binding protein N1/N2-like isoform X3 n=1 Tax=Scylla paramamosain TaxID=85552 RepID=UPI003083205B